MRCCKQEHGAETYSPFFSSIQQNHAVFYCESGKLFLEKTNPSARLILNGEPVTEKEELHHSDRCVLVTEETVCLNVGSHWR